jgi:hypothetical protein
LGGRSAAGLSGLGRRRHGGLLNYFNGVVDIGQLNLQAVHQRGEISDCLGQRAQIAAHLGESCGEAHHGGRDLVGLVAQVLFDRAGNDGDAGIGLVGCFRSRARGLKKGRKLFVL